MTAPDLLRQLADCMEEKQQLEAEVVRLTKALNEATAQIGAGEPLLKVSEAAAFLALSEAFLHKDRAKSKPLIPYLRPSPATIRYRKSDLQAYLDSRVRRSNR